MSDTATSETPSTPEPSEPSEPSESPRSPVLGRVLAFVALAVSAVLSLVNVAASPDIISDEATYGLAGQHVANFNSLTFGIVPIVVHPPFFFLASGGWLTITGQDDGSIVSAITSLRYMNGLFDVGIVLVCGLLARTWLRHDLRRNPAFLAPLAMILVGSDGFLLRFGRAVLIEPMAIFFAVLALFVCWRLRNARWPVYFAGAGISIGVALLVKQPSLFIVGAPLIAAILQLRLRAIGRQLGALAVALVVFGSFAFWGYQTGNGRALYSTQTLNIRRLLGLVQVTGLNRKSSQAGGGAASSVKDTFTQFAGAYLLFLIGAIALVVLAWHLVRGRRRGALSEGLTQLLALGLLSYAFLAYSVLFGQSNQQLTMYTVPAAAMLTAWLVLGWAPLPRRQRAGAVVRHAVTGLAAVGLVVSLLAAFAFFPLRDDNATTRVSNFISRTIPRCVPVNSTGNITHWSFTVRTNPITGFRTGPEALAAGTHLFLVSPRDARYRYGNSSPELNRWVEANGRELFSAPTNVYGSVSLWQVGRLPQPPETDPAACVPAFQTPLARLDAPARRFLLDFGVIVAVVIALAVAVTVVIRRRPAPRHAAAPAGSAPPPPAE